MHRDSEWAFSYETNCEFPNSYPLHHFSHVILRIICFFSWVVSHAASTRVTHHPIGEAAPRRPIFTGRCREKARRPTPPALHISPIALPAITSHYRRGEGDIFALPSSTSPRCGDGLRRIAAAAKAALLGVGRRASATGGWGN